MILKGLIDLNISLDGFVLINSVLKEYYDMKEEIKNLEDRRVNRVNRRF